MPSLRKLLGKGYFPRELPHPFTTGPFSRVVTKRGISLPTDFTPNSKWQIKPCFTAKHNLARVGKLRRVLGIPNPIIQYNLAKEICDSWSLIDAHLKTNQLSVTKPVEDPTNRRGLVPECNFSERPQKRVDARTKGAFSLIGDIQQFYGSVYTHSLPWSLHTKTVSKASKFDFSLLGNRLDLFARSGQDGQTKGIPIGPDTSLVLAEILLTAVDSELDKSIRNLKGFRAIDDYELVFPDSALAETALASFQSTLEKYELRINEEKTGIAGLPAQLVDHWPETLRQFEWGDLNSVSKSRLIEYFSLAFSLAKEFPKRSVLRYAIAVTMSKLPLNEDLWPIYQKLLISIALSEPGTLPYVLPELKRQAGQGIAIDASLVKSAIEQIIERHSPLGHGSEVAWALWSSIALGVRLGSQTTEIISVSDDPVVPLLTLHANKKGLLSGKLDTTSWEKLMTVDELRGEHWLLSYEAGVKGWLPSYGVPDHIRSDPCFSFLRKNKISFYNVRASATGVFDSKRMKRARGAGGPSY